MQITEDASVTRVLIESAADWDSFWTDNRDGFGHDEERRTLQQLLASGLDEGGGAAARFTVTATDAAARELRGRL